MIGIIATIKVQEGKGPNFESSFRAIAAKVKAHENGCRLYQLAKSRTDPDTYKVLELYEDQAAIDTHLAADYFKTGARELRTFFAEPPKAEFLDAVEQG